MFWNFIRGTFRNIAAHKTFTTINILGLAVGIACALIISLYVIYETGYDKFHSDFQNIYRVTVHGQVHDIKFNGASSGGALATAIKTEVDGVLDNVSVARFGAWLVTNDTIRFNEDKILFADSNFFEFFDGFKIIAGDKSTMLRHPRTIVVSESIALKYFNSTNVIGKSLLLETGNRFYTITGVMKDIPSNSHMKFDMIASLVTFKQMVSHWSLNSVYNYLRINSNTSVQEVENQVNTFVSRFVLPELPEELNSQFLDDEYKFELQPLTKIRLHSSLEAELEINGKAVYVYTFGVVAILILIIACLNFMNLSSANSVNRSQEVVLRKLAGAGRPLLMLQFLIESVVYSLIALVFALLLTEIVLPAFNYYLDLSLEFHVFTNIKAVLGILCFTIFLGIIAGSYPAIFISSFEPVKVLQGKFGQGLKNSSVRSVFVVLQFFISVLIIILTIVIYAQTRYMMKKDLGFETEHVIVIRRSDALKDNIESFKKDILSDPDVLSATNSNLLPGRDFINTTFRMHGQKENTTILMNQIFVNYDFYDTYNLSLTQGRFFNSKEPSDSFACVINESAAKLIGLSYPVGTRLEQLAVFKKYSNDFKVIGVVENFHFQAVDKPVHPLVICFMPGNWEGYINVKISPKNIKKTISDIEQTWNRYTPDYPFVYFFLNDDFNKSYQAQIKLGRLFFIFSVLAIFVACLGLFGLISFVANQRVREIGVRKALGASVFSLILMLTKETIKLVMIASVFAWIVGYFLAKYWLSGFYYKMSLSLVYFIVAAFIVLFISVATVLIQTYKAASKEPGEALKYE